MNELKENKKTIIICISLILLVLIGYVIYYIFNNKKDDDIKDITIKEHYDINEIKYIYVTELDVVKKYLNDYKNNILYNKEEAYNSLNEDYRNKKFGNFEEYKKYLDNFISDATYSMEVDKYSVTSINGNKVFNIIDNSGNKYIIKEKSIMNYEVYLDEYAVVID